MAKWNEYDPACLKRCGNKTRHKSGLCGECRVKACKKCGTKVRVVDLSKSHCSKCNEVLKNNVIRKAAISTEGVF